MTREELRDYVELLRSQNEISYNVYSALIDGIDTLEQEPCEDVISRQEAINAIDALYLDGDSPASYLANAEGDTLIGKYQAITALDDLPCVNPQPKTGHWIKGKCDQCGGHAPFWPMASTYYRSEYCPSCGSYNGG
jgi:hypothetical protein